ncbi:uncharacterized protein BCR38DRAFT_188675 [Pseudomassariella vexata]|uniref:Uncharacterized protein n=1 Tax=Pseudomassariella vexata TaxID=1141098 RepID=A0A1Y2E0C7_9PEZI|nr:uncharacterized protein BCR38DRAFT_188675 [Pseudomassariella vexata]ORY64981.1 hypothetical protein BCR38DRAFT_188675 [Pseudomassariella vexata]
MRSISHFPSRHLMTPFHSTATSQPMFLSQSPSLCHRPPAAPERSPHPSIRPRPFLPTLIRMKRDKTYPPTGPSPWSQPIDPKPSPIRRNGRRRAVNR